MSDEAIISILAKSLYESQVQSAKSLVTTLDFDASEIPNIFARLAEESETAKILVFGSYLEDRITRIIRLYLHNIRSVSDEDAVFGSNGPLSDFGGRILIAYQLGWLTKPQKVRLDAFRKLRNEFAHRAFKASLLDDKVVSYLKQIEYNLSDYLRPMREAVIAEEGFDPFKPVSDFSQNDKLLCNLIILASSTFIELLTRPAAMSYHVDPSDIEGPYATCPKPVVEVRQAAARVILNLFRALPKKTATPQI